MLASNLEVNQIGSVTEAGVWRVLLLPPHWQKDESWAVLVGTWCISVEVQHLSSFFIFFGIGQLRTHLQLEESRWVWHENHKIYVLSILCTYYTFLNSWNWNVWSRWTSLRWDGTGHWGGEHLHVRRLGCDGHILRVWQSGHFDQFPLEVFGKIWEDLGS